MISTASPAANSAFEAVAGTDLADHAQCSRHIFCVNGKSVAHRARQRRQIAVGKNLLRQYAPGRAFETQLLPAAP